ncbi:unnamed protein product [Rhizophagus irregularis]|nr:unnamed protein product [Rhizophagus irregularis]
MEENKENTKALIKTIKNIGKSKKNKAKVPDILNGQDSYNEQVIGKENNNIKTAEKVFYENQQKFSKKPLDLTDINQQLEISMNIDQFKELLIVV